MPREDGGKAMLSDSGITIAKQENGLELRLKGGFIPKFDKGPEFRQARLGHVAYLNALGSVR
jgi:hypothetical protein